MLSIKHRVSGETLREVDLPAAGGGDLLRAELAGADLHFAVLYRADMRDCDLRGAFLVDADLAEARLGCGDLRDANCRRVDLRGADLTDANLARADLREANLAGARLAGARLDGAAFTGIVLSDATFDISTRWPSGLDPERYGARSAGRPEELAWRDADLREEGEAQGNHRVRIGAGSEGQDAQNSDAEVRKSVLDHYRDGDSPHRNELDDLIRLSSLICNSPMAVLSLVDAERQWLAGQPGAEGTILPDGHGFFPCLALTRDGEVIAAANGGARRCAIGAEVISGPGYPICGRLPVAPKGAHVLGMLGSGASSLTPDQREALEVLARQAAAHVQLSRAHRDLHEIAELRDRLTGMIVHDLRQPLQSVIGGLHTLRILGPLNLDQQELLRIALGGGEVLLRMINELLDISKLESGTLKLDYSLVDCGALIAAAVGQLEPLAAQKQLRIVSHVEAHPRPAPGDEEKLCRTMVNLIGNAVKFTPSGGTITVDGRESDGGETLLLSVADTGEGIPREAFGLIFEKFGQVETRARGHRMSSGLGLTFCKMIVEAHGGSIRVESEVGRGATFLIGLPYESAGLPSLTQTVS